MKYLLDTCVVSDYVKEIGNVVGKFRSIIPDEIAVSTITQMEIEYGLALQPAVPRRTRDGLKSFLSMVHILPLASDEALVAAQIRAALKKIGRTIGAYDYLLAGTALFRKLILVTSDTSDFQRVEGLTLENWRQ